jgi:hypothetical protein
LGEVSAVVRRRVTAGCSGSLLESVVSLSKSEEEQEDVSLDDPPKVLFFGRTKR